MTATCQFIPPYLLERLAESHTDADVGRDTQRLDARLRERRQEALGSTAQPRVSAAADGTKTVYTAGGAEQLPGTKVRGEGEPASGDSAVDEAYAATGEIYDLFHSQLGRDSIDGAGGAVTVTVHYGKDYDNAFWDGQQLVFGDGDGTVFGRFTQPSDVLFHEFTHGVTQHTAGFTYQGQSGALNESISDCFASMQKQRAAGQSTAEADWLIGAGLFLPSIHATALRSMKAPGTAYDDPKIGKDPQVASMADYLDTTDDSGGVHTNSGIPNRAFYLAATTIGGNSWERPGRIWYAALTSTSVSASTDFAGFAQATIDAAQTTYGDAEATSVRSAWSSVGVQPGASTVGTGASPVAPGRLRIRRSGGFTGMTQEVEVDLVTSPDRAVLESLVAPRAAATVPPPGSGAQSDAFSYTLTTSTYAVTVPESTLGAAQRDTLHRLLRG